MPPCCTNYYVIGSQKLEFPCWCVHEFISIGEHNIHYKCHKYVYLVEILLDCHSFFPANPTWLVYNCLSPYTYTFYVWSIDRAFVSDLMYYDRTVWDVFVPHHILVFTIVGVVKHTLQLTFQLGLFHPFLGVTIKLFPYCMNDNHSIFCIA